MESIDNIKRECWAVAFGMLKIRLTILLLQERVINFQIFFIFILSFFFLLLNAMNKKKV